MAAQQSSEDVYVTLLLSDTYLPGALVLAHSLRDAGTTKKLAVLVTLDSVSVEVSVFDYVLPVPRIRNEQPANLDLMNRRDLHSAFTKINLWNQTQFRRIVYLDADVVAYRAPDELFDLPQPFSAAPDIGWPDLFNTGVLALSPSKTDYEALLALAEKGISFDGADQGLLNIYFKDNYNRLSFSYNVTPSGHYQYVPAYRHFQSSISLVHFIGSAKPWSLGREASSGGSSPYDEMVGRWWAVYDSHYGQTEGSAQREVPEIIQYFVKGEFQPRKISYKVATGEPRPVGSGWDAQRQSPPLDSKPEAFNLQQPHYHMSSDSTPFVPPVRYPSPPKNMWYEIPHQKPAPPSEKPKPIFPWENQQPKASRVFAEPVSQPEPEPSVAEGSTIEPSEASSVEPRSEPDTPTNPSGQETSSDPWASFTRVNAWDDDPAIDKYVESIPLYRRQRSSGSITGDQPSAAPAADSAARSQNETTAAAEWRRRGSKLTDFPTAVERPSLPVTPAPVRRPKFWGASGPGHEDEEDDDEQLPAASGVPKQSEWNPVERLQLLAQQQSDLLLQKLGASAAFGGRDTGDIVSPQPVKPTGTAPKGILDQSEGDSEAAPAASDGSGIPEPSYHGPGAAWEKDEEYLHYSTALPPSEEEKDVLET
ncbi:glycogenin glucosyltransferase [Cytospora paraplurivora]|uniref:glycogenin glucosyltransferase n=1 Tax=Cytospora paraplurivora TaxID=2898453 RepID=A0AAN9YPC5_9PEZI